METGGSFSYDPPRCKKAILVKNRIGYSELVDRVYTYIDLDRTVFNLNLWFRNSVGLSTFAGLRLGCEEDMDMLYHMKMMSLHTACEIYVEM